MKEKDENFHEKIKHGKNKHEHDNENKANDNAQKKDNKIENEQDKEFAELKEKLENLDKKELSNELFKLIKENEKLSEGKLKFETESNNFCDKYKRSMAELENFRKRSVLEKQDLLKYANFNILTDLLVVLDDFQRAFDSARKDEKGNLKNFVDGIEMIEKQFIDLLFKKYGVVKYGEKGDIFDPRIHSAMMAEEGDYEEETVIEVFRKGYLLHDRVVRAAEVKIGKPRPALKKEQVQDCNS